MENLTEEQENILIENCNFLDFIYNLQLISDEQYEFGFRIKKAFQKTREQKTISSYENKQIGNNKTNKPNDGNMVELVKANKDYYLIERYLTKDNKLLLENTICLNHNMIIYLKGLNNNKDNLYDLVYNVCEVFDELEDCFCGNEYERRIKELKKKIEEYGGINKVTAKLNITKKTIIRILKGNKNFVYSNLERLESFLKNA